MRDLNTMLVKCHYPDMRLIHRWSESDSTHSRHQALQFLETHQAYMTVLLEAAEAYCQQAQQSTSGSGIV